MTAVKLPYCEMRWITLPGSQLRLVSQQSAWIGLHLELKMPLEGRICQGFEGVAKMSCRSGRTAFSALRTPCKKSYRNSDTPQFLLLSSHNGGVPLESDNQFCETHRFQNVHEYGTHEFCIYCRNETYRLLLSLSNETHKYHGQAIS